MYTLTLLDMVGIQGYIFGSNGLHEISTPNTLHKEELYDKIFAGC